MHVQLGIWPNLLKLNHLDVNFVVLQKNKKIHHNSRPL